MTESEPARFHVDVARPPSKLAPFRRNARALTASAAPADSDHDHDHDHVTGHIVEEIIVYGRAEQHIGTATSASEGLVGYADYHVPPLLRVGELVEAMPGMVATQHSGTGKANQYFLRGFNLDHGTDFSAHIDGVPVNMRTHGHGQGYLDLNFMIPELAETAAYRKGVHHAEKGDFSSAGSIDFSYYERLDEFEQRDSRSILGLWVQGDIDTWLADRSLQLRWGGDLRYDDIDSLGLNGTRTRGRRRGGPGSRSCLSGGMLPFNTGIPIA